MLAEAGLDDDAVEVVFTGLDRGVEGGEASSYERSLPLDEALRDDVLLAYEMNGGPLLPQHGFPLRLVVPGWYGMTHVKWLTRITAVAEPFTGYQQAQAYRFRRDEDEPGEPVTRMRSARADGAAGHPELPRARAHARRRSDDDRGTRLVRLGAGRARRGQRRRRRDLGRRGARPARPALGLARLALRLGGDPGDHVLCCRARDEAGNAQPDEADWNVGGYANNGVQRVAVRVV